MSKPKLLLFICLPALLFTACHKDNSTTLQITVTEERTGKASQGATINLYTDETAIKNATVSYGGTTGADGKVSISVPFKSQYYIIIENGQIANFYSGYTPIGIFKSQSEVDNSPFQDYTTGVGSIKFKDVNGDGKITEQDKVLAPTINLDEGAIDVYSLKIY